VNTVKTLNPLLDLDPTVYASGFAADAEVRKGWQEKGASLEEAESIRMETDYLAHALSNTKTAVEYVLDYAFPERQWYQAFLTGDDNFRVAAATIKPYKGNRDPNHKPKYYKEIREYLVGKYAAQVVEGQEADDKLAQVQWAHPDKSTVICSIDKDLKMIPGYHFNPKKGEFWYQSIEEAELFFWWQMMVGDATDNIPGVPGVGPKTADKIIESHGRNQKAIEQAVRELYERHYPDYPGAFNEVANLLWMRRKEGEGPNV
jgi:hypothetical protein